MTDALVERALFGCQPLSSVAKNRQIHNLLGQELTNRYLPHDRLPPERELASYFHVSRMTVRSALDQLEKERRIYRIKGVGTFVAQRSISKTIALTSFTEDITSRGMVPTTEVLAAGVCEASEPTARFLSIGPTEPVVYLHRVRFADRTPMCLEKAFLPAQLLPGLVSQDLSSSLYQILTERYGLRPTRAVQTIRSVLLSVDESVHLRVAPHSPAFLVERTTYDQQQRPIERATSLYRGDRYCYEIEISPSVLGDL
jgi:GntR family transcriptional regulator